MSREFWINDYNDDRTLPIYVREVDPTYDAIVAELLKDAAEYIDKMNKEFPGGTKRNEWLQKYKTLRKDIGAYDKTR